VKRSILTVTTVVTLMIVGGTTYGDLVSNGSGLIYDTDLNITWYDYSCIANQWADAAS
jgi:hypothetical protein